MILTSATLTLPWPPSLNHYLEPVVRQSKSGRRYFSKKRTKEANKYRDDVYWLVREQLGVNFSQFRFPVKAEITFHPPNRAKRDLDNFEKVMLDALVNSGLLLDDSLIKKVLKEFGGVVKRGMVVVRISPMATRRC